jgi:hypothetical protein
MNPILIAIIIGSILATIGIAILLYRADEG